MKGEKEEEGQKKKAQARISHNAEEAGGLLHCLLSHWPSE